jgi:hypothetical protein
MSLVAVEARPGEVTLIWHAAGSLEGPATVERRSGEPAWQPLATVFADGSGRIEHRDAGVVAGERYGYRLTYMSEGRRSVTPEVWVDVPAEPRLALEGLRPSPASGEALAWFTLGSGEPATLEMLDLSGRRVLAREVGGLGAGRHAVRLDLSALGPGVYWIRLRQGAQARVRRAVVLE